MPPGITKINHIALLICITFNGLAQNMARLSGYEKRWALLHPFAALKIRQLNKKVTAIYKATPPAALDGYSSGGRLDAYRHVFYMAAFAQKIKPAKLRKLGQAHEKANHRQFLKALKEEGEVPDSLSSVMDLVNNELGFRLGKENKNEDLNALSQAVIHSIWKGEALIMKRNTSGNYLDCENRLIIRKALDKQWNIPKCLVHSDYIYND